MGKRGIKKAVVEGTKKEKGMDIVRYQNLLLNPNIQAYLQIIRRGEGTLGDKGYYKHFGKGYIDSLNVIPPHKVYDIKGVSPNTKKDTVYKSSAVTAFQFLNSDKEPYLEEQANYFGIKDVLPIHQEMFALHRMDNGSTIADILNGNILSAINQTKSIWASLPGAGYNQPTQNLADALLFYQKNGGVLDSKSQNIMMNGLAEKKASYNSKKKTSSKGANDLKDIAAKTIPVDYVQINTLGNYPEWMDPGVKRSGFANTGAKHLNLKITKGSKKFFNDSKLSPVLSPNQIMRNIFIDFPGIRNKWTKPEFYNQELLPDSVYSSLITNTIKAGREVGKATFNSGYLFDTARINQFADIGKKYGAGVNAEESGFESVDGRRISTIGAGTTRKQKVNATSAPDKNAGRTVNINLNTPMIENFTVSTKDASGSISDLRQQVEGMLLEVLNNANTIN